MFIFGKKRESVVVKGIMASRAVYTSPDVQEVVITFITEDKEKLELRINPNHVPGLIGQLESAHEAIHPPLRSRRAAQWDGMMD